MTVTASLLEGLRLMLIGMGLVFLFLLLLVGVLRAMSWLAARVYPEETSLAPAVPAPERGAEERARLAAVISAAVARYRRDHPPEGR